MAATKIISNDVIDMIECALCMQTYDDPRSLPCLHSFCFRCVQGLCLERQSGDRVPCPICRKAFAIPRDGLSSLPKNFILEQLKVLSQRNECPSTDVCDTLSFTSQLCLECRKNFCESCAGKRNAKKKHEQLELHLVEVVSGENKVLGLVFVNDDLIVLRQPTHQRLEVYSMSTFQLQRTLTVDQLADDLFGTMTSCPTNNYLFISDVSRDEVVKVKLTADCCKTSKRRVSGGPLGMSINSAGNILITCHVANRIQEYPPTHGPLIREVCLQSDITKPQHTIQLSNGTYVVAHLGPVNGVSVVNAAGLLVFTYRNCCLANTDTLNEPVHLAVTGDGEILVADSKNNRILLLNASLGGARDLCRGPDGAFKLSIPSCFHLGDSRRTGDVVYVGEYEGRRVIKFIIN